MSIQALNWAIKQKTDTPTTKLVLFILANYCDERFSCYPSEAKLAEICGVSDRQIRRCLKGLDLAGLLRSEPRISPKGQISNRYHLSMDTHVHPRMDTHVHGGVTPTSTYTKEDTKIYTKDFEAWWSVYPRKAGKCQASRAYKKSVREISPKKLLEITIRFAAINNKTENRFIPHAATWLNGKRYLDEDMNKEMTINNLAG